MTWIWSTVDADGQEVDVGDWVAQVVGDKVQSAPQQVSVIGDTGKYRVIFTTRVWQRGRLTDEVRRLDTEDFL